MLLGELTYDDERIILDIMHNNSGYVVIDDEVHFTVNNKQHIVKVSYMKKPKDRLSFDDSVQEVIAKKCIIVEFTNMKAPIFKGGLIYTNIFFPGTDIRHLVCIKNSAASRLYSFVLDLMEGMAKE